ncbi:hypothetical protein EGR_02385 [Echinococcus granulosus]|uniref:Uncharacterized protein n=1 Tax=Echinococcus granulosus TaxID=6210 RepID=W6V7X7_ECHGR|nr:hypothetical protein EGR_02385 [Echinococcus granulosus]EUB62589.1 hypothetical protein EGR_02385 [Echinococcus granulosus]
MSSISQVHIIFCWATDTSTAAVGFSRLHLKSKYLSFCDEGGEDCALRPPGKRRLLRSGFCRLNSRSVAMPTV